VAGKEKGREGERESLVNAPTPTDHLILMSEAFLRPSSVQSPLLLYLLTTPHLPSTHETASTPLFDFHIFLLNNF
jgi:hypothetical protein